MRSIKGFTLIELLVVVAIIGVIASVGTVAYSGYVSKAKDIKHKDNTNKVLKFLKVKSMDCELGIDIKLKNKSGATETYECDSDNKIGFANALVEHVNNHVCTNIYRKNRGCMEITGGYIEETIAVDTNPGDDRCAIMIRSFVDKKHNEPPYEYNPTLFKLPGWSC